MKVKKALSLILALVMVFTLVPAQLIFSSANYSHYTTEDIGAATKFVTDVTLEKSGDYNGLVRVGLKIAVDNSQMGNDNSFVTAFQNVLRVDSTKLSPVSSAKSSRGQATLTDIIAGPANQAPAYKVSKKDAGAKFALFTSAVPTFAYDEDEEEYVEGSPATFSVNDLSALSYNATSNNLYVCLAGLAPSATEGALLNTTEPTEIIYTYFRMLDGTALTDVPSAISLVTESEIRSDSTGCLSPNIISENQMATTKTAAAFVTDNTIAFSDDFAPAAATYTVHYKYEDGTEFKADETVEEGTSITLPTIPDKDADDTYTYAVDGWYNGENKVTGNQTITGETTFTAKYTSTYKNYNVYFVDELGANIIDAQENLHWGDAVTIPDETQTAKAGFTFLGWFIGDDQVTPSATVNGSKTYVAKYEEEAPSSYNITFKWKTAEGDQQQVVPTNAGSVPVPPEGSTANYEDATKNYTFTGWDSALAAATANKTYIAQYSETTKKATLTFVYNTQSETGKSVGVPNVEYGSDASASVPEDATSFTSANGSYTYTLTGWSPALGTVAGDQTYTAQYSTTENPADYTEVDAAILAADEIINSPEYAAKYTTAAKQALNDAINAVVRGKLAGDQNDVNAMAAAIVGAKEAMELPASIQDYTITWLQDDNSQIDTTTVKYGDTPTHADASKTETAQYTYTFTGWDPAISAVTGDATYKATYTSNLRSYTVTFKNGDEVLQSGLVAYGTVPVYNGAEPTKAADSENTYTFSGWNAELTEVTGPVTYTAQFTAHPIVPGVTYTVVFVDENDNTLATFSDKNIGDTITAPTAPEKTATEQYTYTFAGWDPAFNGTVTGNATYKATYTPVLRSYTVTFKNGDEVLQSGLVAYGTTPAYTGDTPTKDATEQYTYTFSGWNPELASVTGEAVYTAQFTPVTRSYTVTFKNGDDVLQSGPVEYGTTPAYTGDTPTKDATAQYTYTFAGWDKVLSPVTGAETYNATFTPNLRSYNVTFKNGDDVLQSGLVAYGTTPAYEGSTPTKAATAQYTYTFAGWNPELASVTGEAVYTAQFTPVTRSYTVTFKNGDDVLQSGSVAYGTTPAYEGSTPTKAATAQYTYTFNGWNPAIEEVTGNATYYATFTQNLRSYTVTFKNGDEVLQSGPVAYGSTPVYAGSEPTKAATAQYTYTFAGWDNAIAEVTGDATYNATFTPNLRSYTVTFKNGEEVLQSGLVAYGTTPVYSGSEPTKAATAQYTYTFAGWDNAIAEVTGDATYNATFTPNLRSYTVTFKNGEEVLQSGLVAYGTTPVYSGSEPTKAATAEYTYTFTGWDNPIAAVTGDATYNATFSAQKNKYDVTVVTKNTNGEDVSSTTKVEYGETPVLPEPATNFVVGTTKYTFTGWDKAAAAVTGPVTYTAQYETSTVQNPVYTVNFKYAETVEQAESKQYVDHNQQIEEGDMPNIPTPENLQSATMKYEFAGWDVTPVAVTGDVTYTAQYTETPILQEFEINFRYADTLDQAKVGDGELADHIQVVTEGNMPNIPTPESFVDGNTTYKFVGWDKEVTEATESTVYTAIYQAETPIILDFTLYNSLVERYEQMVLTGLYNKSDLMAVKALIDEIRDKIVNGEFTSQDEVDAMTSELKVVEDSVRRIEKQETEEEEEDIISRRTRRTTPATGDNATLVVMSIILVSSIGIAVLSLKKKRENI